jgi:4-hydroxybenzoate polyprenyltransferase
MISNIYSVIKKEIVYGGHITALIGPSLLISMLILFNKEINIYAIIISYLIPLIVYSFNYQQEFKNDIITNPDKVEYLQSKNKIFPYLMLFYIGLSILILILLNNINILFFMLIIFTGGILYTIIFKVLTRNIPGFKSIYATFIWAYYGTFFAVFLYSLNFNYLIIIIFLFMFLKLFANAIFFDVKDIEADKNEGLKTIPIILGKNRTMTFINIINVISLILLLIGIITGELPIYSIVLALFFFYTYFYSNNGIKADIKTLLKYTYILADAEFFFWPIVLLISKIVYYNII